MNPQPRPHEGSVGLGTAVPKITALDAAQHKTQTGLSAFMTIPNSPTQQKVAFNIRGWSKRAFAMTRKVTLEFVVPTVLSVALAIVLSIGAVYLSNIYLGPIDEAEANYSVVGKR